MGSAEVTNIGKREKLWRGPNFSRIFHNIFIILCVCVHVLGYMDNMDLANMCHLSAPKIGNNLFFQNNFPIPKQQQQ